MRGAPSRPLAFSALFMFHVFMIHVSRIALLLLLTSPALARPNFLFILIDDLRHDAVAALGNSSIRTPNLDSIANAGIRFKNAFVTTSICSPSRAACLTGRYGSRNGVMKLGEKLREGEVTIAAQLKSAGYQTGFVGKWHIGPKPADAGFDFVSFFESNGPQYNRKVIEAGKEQVAKGYIESYNAARAVAFLEQAARTEAPFFLHLCTQSPHMTPKFQWESDAKTLATYDASKMPLPANWNDDLAGKPPYLANARFRTQARKYGYESEQAIREHWRGYCASVTQMDQALAPVLEALGRLKLNDNTYVIVMGDNGWMMGEHGLTSKVLAYEPAIRVPMFIRGPGITPSTADQLVLNIDLPATILDLATVKPQRPLHGASLAPIWSGKPQGWRESIYYEALAPELESWPLVALRTADWKLIQTFDLANPDKLAFEELYNLKTDPHELKNLAQSPDQTPRLEQMRNQLTALRQAFLR